MALLNAEQSAALESLSQRERIDAVLNVLIRRMERDNRRQTLRQAIEVVEDSSTKTEALARLKQELDHAN